MDRLTVAIVNKKAFIQMVQQYHQDFQIILNRKIYGEDLLAEGKSTSFLSHVLMNHDGLIGILLGYGRDNALWYHQKYRLHSAQERAEFCEKFDLGFRLTDELGSVWSDEEYAKFREEWPYLPSFRADPTSLEAKHLRKQYLETREVIRQYYAGKDFLEATLKLLTS